MLTNKLLALFQIGLLQFVLAVSAVAALAEAVWTPSVILSVPVVAVHSFADYVAVELLVADSVDDESAEGFASLTDALLLRAVEVCVQVMESGIVPGPPRLIEQLC